jgi:hypothetical protein
MIRSARIPATALAVVMSLLVGCSDDDPTQPEPNDLDPLDLVVNLDASAVAEFGAAGHVFASDGDGAVLAVATWNGIGTVTLADPDGAFDTVTLTVVGSGGGKLRTLRPVPPTSEQTILGEDHSDLDGSARVTLQNVPAHASYMVASNGTIGYGHQPLGEGVTVDVHGPVTDCYLRFDEEQGPVSACWLRDLHIDDEPTVDLAAAGVLLPLDEHTLNIPGLEAGDELDWRVDRRYPAGAWPELIRLDANDAPSPASTVTVHLDADMWSSSELYTQIVVRAASGPNYVYVIDGPWPATLPTVDSSLTITSHTPDRLAWEWVEARHRATCIWAQVGDGVNVQWTTEGWGGTGESMALPQLPEIVTDAWPHLVREDFVPATLVLEHDVDAALTIRVAMAVPD